MLFEYFFGRWEIIISSDINKGTAEAMPLCSDFIREYTTIRGILSMQCVDMMSFQLFSPLSSVVFFVIAFSSATGTAKQLIRTEQWHIRVPTIYEGKSLQNHLQGQHVPYLRREQTEVHKKSS